MTLAIYTALTIFNQRTGKKYYSKFSKIEKIGLGACLAIGIDSIVVPAFTGKTLNEMCSLNLPETVDQGILIG